MGTGVPNFSTCPHCIKRKSESLEAETEAAMSLVQAAAIHPGAIRQELTESLNDVREGLLKADKNSTELSSGCLLLPGSLGEDLYKY